jgi:hypothetical protein
VGGLIIALAIGTSAAGWTTSGASPVHLHNYGPFGGRFTVSFAAPTNRITRDLSLATEGDWKLQMKSDATGGYVADLGASAYEQVSVAVYPRTPSAADVTRYLEWNSAPGGELRRWRGLPGAYEDQACREGDSPIRCPGRVADLWIVKGPVVYELRATQVSQAEVARFFGSFRPTE